MTTSNECGNNNNSSSNECGNTTANAKYSNNNKELVDSKQYNRKNFLIELKSMLCINTNMKILGHLTYY